MEINQAFSEIETVLSGLKTRDPCLPPRAVEYI